MASSRAALSSSQFTPTQPRLHGACILPGHILVNERFHESDVVKTLQENHVNIQMDDCMGVVDFNPSSDVGVVYLSEADLVGGYNYKEKLLKFGKASFRKVIIAEKTSLSSQYFYELQKFIVMERGLVLLPVASPVEAGRILAQMVLLESKPQSNPYRIKMKPQATDQAVLTTLQNVPGVGQKKAVALLSKFNSIEQICKASVASLATVVGNANALQIKDFFSATNARKQ
nr:Fanconi anemia core complex-associated protein 24-like [Pocillopora verrucosa]